MNFTRNQSIEFQRWKRKFDRVSCGAIGGGFTYVFVVRDGEVINKYVEFFKGGVWRPSMMNDASAVETVFDLTESQLNRASAWIKKEKVAVAVYKIIPTSIGTALKVESEDGRKIDLSDYDDW